MARVPEQEISQMRKVVCFDTAPLIWRVRGDASRQDEHMIEVTKKYIKFLEVHRYSIMVPAPVVAEYFVGATATQLREAQLLRRGYEVPVLDLPASMLAAKLQRGGIVDSIHDEYGIPKQNIRIDAFIIAIAIVNYASRIITDNVNEFVALAKGQIIIEPVPTNLEPPRIEGRPTEEQRSLFRDFKEEDSSF